MYTFNPTQTQTHTNARIDRSRSINAPFKCLNKLNFSNRGNCIYMPSLLQALQRPYRL